jgi:WS/DGAT/MGAT family acyltransferase
MLPSIVPPSGRMTTQEIPPMPLPAERMSRVDTAWLRMDSDVNRMLIVGVWLLAPAIGIERLRERVADKLLCHDRFRQKVVHDVVGASWVEDEAFDIDRHVRLAQLAPRPGQSQRQALQELCGELAATALDASHPLWQLQLVEDYEGGSAIVARIHHCIGDGVALVAVMTSITDGGPELPRRRRVLPEPDAPGDWLAEAVIRPLTEVSVRAIDRTADGLVRSIDALAHAEGLPVGREAARAGLQVLQDVAALALMPDDSPTLLKGRPAGVKRVAWSEPLPLDEVKSVGKGLGCSVNDVLLSCAAGAIGGMLRDRGDDPRGKAIRAMVPVNLRAPGQAWQLGNRFGLAPLQLPIGIDNPVERVYDVHGRMAQLKGSYQPLLAYAVLALSGLFVKPVQDSILGLFARKTTAVMTNVPGPREPLAFCGSTLKQTMFWVPTAGDIGVGLSILSYGGGVQLGLITDERLCPDPQRVVDRFEPEFEALLLATLMLPWES